MLPDFSQDPAAAWMAEDVIDFSPTFLEDGPVGLGGGASAVGGGRESPPAATPPPYRCLSHQGHSHSSSQRSVTEDPDSVLNQSEAGPRRSLILAATAPQTQVYCQHRPSTAAAGPTHLAEPGGSPSHSQTPSAAGSAPTAPPPQERRSFTRKMVHALSPKAPKSPPLDISDPIAISVPAKVRGAWLYNRSLLISAVSVIHLSLNCTLLVHITFTITLHCLVVSLHCYIQYLTVVIFCISLTIIKELPLMQMVASTRLVCAFCCVYSSCCYLIHRSWR